MKKLATAVAVLSAAVSAVSAFAASVVVTDLRVQERPIYCRTIHDYANRLSVIARDSREIADQFEVRKVTAKVQGDDLVIDATLRFVTCESYENGTYGWERLAVRDSQFNFAAVPRTQKNDPFLGAALTSLDGNLHARIVRPLNDVLFSNEIHKLHKGKTVESVSLFLTFLPSGLNSLRVNVRNPGYYLIFDVKP